MGEWEDLERKLLALPGKSEPKVEPAARPHPSKIESFARGAAQVATFGFSDELVAAARTLGIDPRMLYASLAAGPMGPAFYAAGAVGKKLATEGAPTIEEYRQERKKERAARSSAAAENPKTYLAGELVSGAATMAIPVGGVATAGRALATGAVAGGAAMLGASEADLTKGEVGGAAVETGIGAIAGTTLGALLHGAGPPLARAGGRVVQYLAEKVGGRKQELALAGPAGKLAKEVAKGAQEVDVLGGAKTRQLAFEEGQEIERSVTAEIKKEFHLTPGQSTGDPAQLLAEQAAHNMPRTMSAIQRFEDKQLAMTAEYLDAMVSRTAAKPGALGRSNVGQMIGKALLSLREKIAKRGSAEAGPLYKAAGERGTMIDADPISDAIEKILKESGGEFNASPGASQLQSTLAKLMPKKAGEERKLTISEAQGLRSMFSNMVGDPNSILPGSMTKKAWSARQVLNAVDASLKKAEDAGGEGAALLRQANAAWAKRQRQLEEIDPQMVRKMLGVEETAQDTIPQMLLNASDDQVRGVFVVLRKANPKLADQTYAQMFDDILTKAGKPPRGGSIAVEEGATRLRPFTALNALVKNESRLVAASGEDQTKKEAIRNSMRLLKRVSAGPRIRGSNTMSQMMQLLEGTAEAAGSSVAAAAGGAVGGPVVARMASVAAKPVLNLLGSIFSNKDALGRVYSTDQGIRAFNAALTIALRGKPPVGAELKVIRSLADIAGVEIGD